MIGPCVAGSPLFGLLITEPVSVAHYLVVGAILFTAGVACMVMIANLQYGWTLFVHPILDRHGWGRPAIQVAFTIFVLAETWLVPIEGWIVDRFGPKLVVMAGGVLIGCPR